MKLLASLALGTATMVAATFGLTAPAAADDDVTVGVRLGPLCVGLCISGDDHRGRHHHGSAEYDEGYYDDGFYAHREDYYHQTYDRRGGYDEARDDGYAGYRHRYASNSEGYGRDYDDGGRSRGRHHHHDRDDDE